MLKQIETVAVTGLEGRDIAQAKAVATKLLDHVERGGGLGFLGMRKKVVKEGLFLIDEVRVNGEAASSRQPLTQLLVWLGAMERLQHVDNHWEFYCDVPTGPLRARCASYHAILAVLDRITALSGRIQRVRDTVAKISGLIEPTWNDGDAVDSLVHAATAVDTEEDLQAACAPLDQLCVELQNVCLQADGHSSSSLLFEAATSRNSEGYASAHAALCRIWELRAQLERRRSLLDCLNTRLPKVTAQLCSSYSDPVWDSRLGSLSTAWHWAQAQRWLCEFSDPGLEANLAANLETQRDKVFDKLGALAAELAWQFCLSRLTEAQREHLVSWKKAVDRIGKGTGKYAEVHRRAARQHMEHCRPAIPAWIMPIYRVAENVGAVPEAFDVVIVDEASQSGPEALFLQYIGRKIIVVGDDKQISPEAVGFDREDVAVLRQRFISDLPHNDAIGVDNSFFDLAEIHYQERIPLREHFRCVPEIIQFSNNMWYTAQPLILLRQYGAARLEPVKTVHIQKGYQQGATNIINPPEAEAIVDRIIACCQDAEYDGKSMGVISLLGPHQARHIEQLLLRRLGPEEMEKRNLVCGDANSWQGDQRNVVFLSLVSAPGGDRRIASLITPNHQRRFNVAASRAEDQMWLLTTATFNDLHPDCLRYRLLEYCHTPGRYSECGGYRPCRVTNAHRNCRSVAATPTGAV